MRQYVVYEATSKAWLINFRILTYLRTYQFSSGWFSIKSFKAGKVSQYLSLVVVDTELHDINMLANTHLKLQAISG